MKQGTGLAKGSQVPPKLPPKKASLGKEQARTIFPYEGMYNDELTICEGDIVTILSKESEDQGWWTGELNGKVGVFPEDYVQIIKPGEIVSSVPYMHSSNTLPSLATSTSEDIKNNELATRKSQSENKLNKMFSSLTGGPKFGELLKTESKNTKQEDEKLKINSETSPNTVLGRKSRLFGTKAITKSESVQQFSSSVKDEELPKSTTIDTDLCALAADDSQKLTHLTANRVRGPRDRRPPSIIALNKDEEDNSNLTESFVNLSCSSTSMSCSVERLNRSQDSQLDSEEATSGVQLRHHSRSNSISDQNKSGSVPPWMVELKKTQEKKNEIRKKSFSFNAESDNGKISAPTPSSPTKHSSGNNYRMSGDFGMRLKDTSNTSLNTFGSTSLSRTNSMNNGSTNTSLSTNRAPSSDSLESKETKSGGISSAPPPVPLASTKPAKAAKPPASKLMGTSSTSSTNTSIANRELLELQKEIKLLKETSVSKKEFDELVKRFNELSETVETQRNSYKTLIKDIINDFAEEKKKVANLHIEVDRLRKITSTV